MNYRLLSYVPSILLLRLFSCGFLGRSFLGGGLFGRGFFSRSFFSFGLGFRLRGRLFGFVFLRLCFLGRGGLGFGARLGGNVENLQDGQVLTVTLVRRYF